MLTLTLLSVCSAATPQGPQFEAPVRLKAGDAFIQVEAPGYACPSWADVDVDGKKDLVVGQFRKGAEGRRGSDVDTMVMGPRAVP